MDTFSLKRGNVPLLISLPHNGSHIPDELARRMHPQARRSPDTDWHIAQLYEPLAEQLGASVLKPVASRYVIDLNRPADGQALIPGGGKQGWYQPSASMASRSIWMGRSRTLRKSGSGSSAGGSLTMPRWQGSWRG